MASFLEDNGLAVVSMKMLCLTEGIYLQPVGAAYRLAKEVDHELDV